MDPFEQSADMRLLELQRKALGKAAPPPSTWSATAIDMHEGIALEEAEAPALRGARLLVDLSANPKAKLVAGAVVTVSLALQNAGDQVAQNVRVSVPLPGEATFRDGSLQIDGRTVSASYADAFLGEGYTMDRLEAGQRTGFVWKLSIERGAKPLLLAPRVTSENSAVVGSSFLLLKRGAARNSAKLPAEYLPEPPEIERPFYELDAHEEQNLQTEFPETKSDTRPAAPLFVMPDVVPETVPADVPALEVPAAREPQAPQLFCTFDATTLALVKKLFAAESFGQIPHYILQNSLACSLNSNSRDTGLRTHFSQQAGLLSRALLMQKLAKSMNVADFSAGKTGFELVSDPVVPPADAPSRLYMTLASADVEFCAPVEARNQLESFIRLRQLAVALQARHCTLPDPSNAAAIDALLAQYATAARAAINRTFIKAKLDRNFDPFRSVDAATDALAHDLVTALEAVVTA